MNEILMCGTDPVGQLYKDTKAEATSIAPIEVSPAESSHSVGTHIMVDGVRYKVTSAISVGDTLTIGTNISAENIEDNLNATDIKYDNNTSVKGKIDSMTENLTLTGGTYSQNVGNVRACILNGKVLMISGVVYLSSDIVANVDILDLGKSFSTEYYGYLYSLGADNSKAIKISGSKLKANVAIPTGNLYMEICIVL